MSVTLKAQQPARLDIIDLPRDEQRCLGGLRSALCATFNYTKQYPAKLAVFVEVLEYVLARAKEWSTEAVEAALEAQKAAESARLEAEKQAELDAIKAVHDTAIAAIKSTGKEIIVAGQEINELVELKEFIITHGYSPVGDTIDEIKATFVKEKTAAILSEVAAYKETNKEQA